jgi:hypothetical protein
MAYNRFWFKKDLFGLTLGGGAISNPGRYLVLLPPINGATAISGTPYFTANPGDKYRAWDASATFDYMPQPVRHVPLGIQSPRGQCAVFLRLWRDHASRRQRGAAGFVRPGLDTGSSQIRESFHSGAAGEIVIS